MSLRSFDTSFVYAPVSCWNTYRWLALGKEVPATLGLSLGEGGISYLGNINSIEADLRAGSDGVSLVDALNGHAIDLAGAGHKEETRWELSEEDNALSSEPAGKQDENRAWNDTFTELGGISLLSSHHSLLVVSGIPRRSFDH